jgi:hypothetical protein
LGIPFSTDSTRWPVISPLLLKSSSPNIRILIIWRPLNDLCDSRTVICIGHEHYLIVT